MTIGMLVAWLVLGFVDQSWIDAQATAPTTTTTVSDDGMVRTMDGPDQQPPKP